MLRGGGVIRVAHQSRTPYMTTVYRRAHSYRVCRTAVGRYGVSWLYSPARAEVLAAEVRAAGGIMTAADILVRQCVCVCVGGSRSVCVCVCVRVCWGGVGVWECRSECGVWEGVRECGSKCGVGG